MRVLLGSYTGVLLPKPVAIAGVAISVTTDWNGAPVTTSTSGRPFASRYAVATRLAISFVRSSPEAVGRHSDHGEPEWPPRPARTIVPPTAAPTTAASAK